MVWMIVGSFIDLVGAEKTSATSLVEKLQSQPILSVAIVLVLVAFILAYILSNKPKKNLPPTISGPIPFVGCAFKYAQDPPALLKEGYEKFGEVFSIYLFGERMTILAGPEPMKVFFTAKEDAFSANQAYRFTVPVFGKGVVYDVDPDVLVEQKRMIKDSLTTTRFKKYIEMIVEETENYFEENWGDKGEKDILDAFNKLTVYTSTRCLQGQEVRDQFNEEFASLYMDLDAALSPIGFFFPNAPLPSMRRRDGARKKLGELFEKIMEDRKKNPINEERHDILQTLMECTYKDGSPVPAQEIVGLLVALLLAGQHTSNVTSTWLGLFLLNNPKDYERALEEQERIMEGKEKLGYDELKSMEFLERAMKETLRLRPPIIMLMRRVLQDVECKGYTIPAGSLVSVAPCLTHRLETLWENPNAFDPDRYLPEREKGLDRYAHIAFGSGRHKCSGEIFAYIQIKTIWSVLLRKYKMKLVGKLPEPDYTTLIAGPIPPCTIQYEKRK